MVSLNNITVIYPDKTKAIDKLNLKIQKGENIALLGENGAGKTSLLLAVCGILELQYGTIEVNGIQLTKKTVNEARKQIGMVFQNPDDQLFMPYIFDDAAFGCRHSGMSEGDVKLRVDETLELLNISHLRERSSLKLSGGEKRMAAIATVLAMRPELLMFDEPTAFLDHKARRALIETLKSLPHTKIIASHDLDFVSQICDRAVLLKKGQIRADGDLSLLRDSELMTDCGLEQLTVNN